MPKSMPPANFKKVITVDRVDPDKLGGINGLVEWILDKYHSHYRLVANGNTVLLSFIFDTHNGLYECRSWLSSKSITCTCNFDSKFNFKNIIKIYFESFIVTPLQAVEDINTLRKLGLCLTIMKISGEDDIDDAILKELEKRIDIDLLKFKSKKILSLNDSKSSPICATTQEKQLSVADCITKILLGVIPEIPEGIRDPVEALEQMGYVILGDIRREKLACLTWGSTKHCKYLLIIVSQNDLLLECFRNVEQLRKYLKHHGLDIVKGNLLTMLGQS